MTRWNIEGHYILACNCGYGCPCNFQAPPSAGWCEGAIGFHAESGAFGDVALDGRAAFLAVKWPGAIHDGGGAAAAYVEEAATREQRDALATIIMGKVGGPWAMFASTFKTLSGPHVVPIHARVAGKETSVSVGGNIRMVFEAIRNPVTHAEVFPRVVLPQGMLYQEGEQFALKEFWVKDGPELSFAHQGTCASLAKVSWQGP